MSLVVSAMIRLICVTLVTVSVSHAYYDTGPSPFEEENQMLPYRSQNPMARKMALSIARELEKRAIPEDAEELEEVAKADQIIREVNSDYGKIAIKINELNRERSRLNNLRQTLKRRRRLVILKNLRHYYHRR